MRFGSLILLFLAGVVHNCRSVDHLEVRPQPACVYSADRGARSYIQPGVLFSCDTCLEGDVGWATAANNIMIYFRG
ncbi:hypothetical protein AMECASPLE_017034 [Ameca splendens]|uniref:Secreted protein n=1 Tax=Ameca splendens TaxID=208324 RepID=A0ABV0ZB42_9TELE